MRHFDDSSQYSGHAAKKGSCVYGESALNFFSASGLPEELLAQIWDEVDRLEPTGELSREEFFDYLKLIALVQVGNRSNGGGGGGGDGNGGNESDGSSSGSSSGSSGSDDEGVGGDIGNAGRRCSGRRNIKPVVENLALRAPLPRVGRVEARLAAWKVTAESEARLTTLPTPK